MEMNQHTKQQNLELFIQEVINYLKKNFNYTKEEINDCIKARKGIWEKYMKDLSQEKKAKGIASGFI